MTEQEIKDIAKKKLEAQRKKKGIQAELKEIGKIPSASDYFSSGNGIGKNDPTANEVMYREELQRILMQTEREIEAYDKVLRNVFRRIKDPVVKIICKCKLLKAMSWSEIAEMVDLDEPAAKMRYYRFRDKQLIAEC